MANPGTAKFQLTHLLRGATRISGATMVLLDFNSRTSCEVRPDTVFLRLGFAYFNSRTSCEVRHRPVCGISRSPGFQLTHLLRGATSPRPVSVFRRVFQLTHLLRGATNLVKAQLTTDVFQLTHLLRGATHTGADYVGANHFNSRTSCEVRPGRGSDNRQRRSDFNSRTSCEVRQRGGID